MEPKNTKLVVYGKESRKDNEIYYVRENDFQSAPADYTPETTALNEIQKIENLQLGNKKFLELFTIDDLSLWWFIYPQIFPQILKALTFIVNFSKFLDDVKPKSVNLIDEYKNLEIIKQLCAKNNLPLQYSKTKYFLYRIQNSIRNKLHRMGLKALTKKKIKFRKNLGSKRINPINNLQDKIIFVASPTYRRKNLNFNTGETETKEFLLDNLIKIMNNTEDWVGIDVQNNIKSNENVLVERLRDSKISWLPIELLLQKDNSEKIYEILNEYKKLILDKELQNCFEFQDIRYWSVIESTFKKMQNKFYLPFWIWLVYSLEKTFSDTKPKSVILPYETGPISLSFITACRRLGIKTNGIQHGIIYETHASYSHTKFFTDGEPSGFPLPDNLLLFGKPTQEMLLKKGYPEENLLVFGNPEFFELSKLEKILDKEKLREKYGIDKDTKIILYLSTNLQEDSTTQGTRKFNFDSLSWKKLLNHYANKKDYFVILKPHPAEGIRVYEKILNESNASNAKIITEDLYGLIFLSSIVVSIMSSAMVDALCFKKPVLQVKFEGVEFRMPFDNFNAVCSTYFDDFVTEIDRILFDNNKRISLIENGTKFVEPYYNILSKNKETLLKKILN